MRRWIAGACLLVAAAAATGVVRADGAAGDAGTPAAPAAPPAPARAWHNTADLGLIVTSGNARNTNIAASDLFTVHTQHWDAEFKVRVLRVVSTKFTVRPDFSDPNEPRVNVTEKTDVTTEIYEARTRISRTVHKRLATFVNAGWERNEPAGLWSRTTGGLGLSYRFDTRPTRLVRLDAGADGVREAPVTGERRHYLGARLASRFETDVSPTSRVLLSIEALQSLRDDRNLRVNGEAGLTTSINAWLAVKLGYTVRYARSPQTQAFRNPVAGKPDAVHEFRTTDTVFSTSLVMKF